jgi:hypothetical protein
VRFAGGRVQAHRARREKQVPREKEAERDPVAVELEQIKNLLVLLLLKAGTSSDEIALATGMGASTVRKAFPARGFGPFGAKPR